MMELEFRENEYRLTVNEMQADIEKLLVNGSPSQAPRAVIVPLSTLEVSPPTMVAIKAAQNRKSLNQLVSSFSQSSVQRSSSRKIQIMFDRGHFPCFVVEIDRLVKMEKLIDHEEAHKQGALEELTMTSQVPSCALTFFISQNWESNSSPDNELHTKVMKRS